MAKELRSPTHQRPAPVSSGEVIRGHRLSVLVVAQRIKVHNIDAEQIPGAGLPAQSRPTAPACTTGVRCISAHWTASSYLLR